MKVVLVNANNKVINVAVPGDDAWFAAMQAKYALVIEVDDSVRVAPKYTLNDDGTFSPPLPPAPKS